MKFPLELPPGIVSDETAFAASGRYLDGSNVRPRAGRMEPIGGWVEAYASAVTGTCRNLHSWLDATVLSNIAFGTHTKLMILKGGSLSDITPTGLNDGLINPGTVGYGQGGYGIGGYGGGPLTETYPRTWSFANWGQNLIANPRGKGIYIWENNPGSIATRITQAPTNNTCVLVNSNRQIMSFGCQEVTSGEFNAMCIRGCDFEDYTNWTPTTSNNAFEKVLEGGGRIVRAAAMGPYVIVWTDTSVFQGYYTGDSVNPWRFDLIADNCGLAGPNALSVVNQAAYWLTKDLQFYTFRVGLAPAPMPCPISKDFRDNIVVSHIDKVVATSVSQFNEIWWFHPDGRDAAADWENSRYVAVSLDNNEWFKGVMARTAAIDSGPAQYPVYVDPDSMVYYHENGDDANGEALEWFVETADFYIDSAQRTIFLDGMWPDFKSQVGNVTMTIKAKDYPQASARVKGPWTLAPGREKRDFTFEARIVAVKFAGSAAGTFARIGKPVFGGVLAGEH